MGFDMRSQQTDNLRQTADGLLAATNDFDAERALKLFTRDAVIDDPSTGHRFDGHAGIRTYIEQYFIGYGHDNEGHERQLNGVELAHRSVMQRIRTLTSGRYVARPLNFTFDPELSRRLAALQCACDWSWCNKA
jgi:hypothetical protein